MKYIILNEIVKCIALCSESLDESVRVIVLRVGCDDMNSKACSFYCYESLICQR